MRRVLKMSCLLRVSFHSCFQEVRKRTCNLAVGFEKVGTVICEV